MREPGRAGVRQRAQRVRQRALEARSEPFGGDELKKRRSNRRIQPPRASLATIPRDRALERAVVVDRRRRGRVGLERTRDARVTRDEREQAAEARSDAARTRAAAARSTPRAARARRTSQNL